MIIQYYGLSCFKVTTKPEGRGGADVTIFFAPFDKSTGLRPPQGAADMVFIPHDSPAFNNAGSIKNDPKVFDMPGEYAISGVSAIGTTAVADQDNGAQRGNTTIFSVQTEGLTLCHLGALGTDLDAEQFDHIGDVDILFVPVGDHNGITAKLAEKICRSLQPRIIIPMHYQIKGAKEGLSGRKDFCAEIGSCPKEQLQKLTLKKKDLEEKTMEVILLDTV